MSPAVGRHARDNQHRCRLTYSLWPLLKTDGLGLQYLAMLLLWNRLIGHNAFKLQLMWTFR